MPFDGGPVLAAAVYCSDGRFGEHFDTFMNQRIGTGRYGLVAVPGGAGSIIEENNHAFEQLEFVIGVHGLGLVVLISHDECAYYRTRRGRAPEEVHRQQIDELIAAAEKVESLGPQVRAEAWFAALEGGEVVFHRVRTPEDRLRFGG